VRREWIAVVALVVVLGTLIVVGGGCAATRAPLDAVNDSGQQRMINVSGSGTISAEPDRVVVRLGVEVMAEDASQALSQNSQQMQAVIDALKGAGVPAEDIQTQTVQVRAQYETPEREPGQAVQRQLVGYVATNVVEASSEDLGAIGSLLDAAVQAGANRVEGIRFEASDSEELLAQAREAAWQDAEQKALELADLAGVQLGEVLSIDESTSTPRPVGIVREVEEAAPVPIEPGTEQIRVDLRVTWTLQQ
jgi:hypothetical protein